MKKVILIALLVLAISIPAFLLLSQNSSTPRSAKPKIAATIYPAYDLARQVAGDQFEVVLLVPPGASPHTFEPSPQDIAKIQGSQAIFAIGHGLDSWIVDAAQNAGVQNVITLDQNISLIESDTKNFEIDDDHADEEAIEDGHGHEEGVNPHYWLSLINGQQMVKTIETSLLNLNPQTPANLTANAATLQQQLSDLHQQALQQAQNSSITSIATFHNAWDYFARDYGLEIAATFEESPGTEPSPQYLQNFQQQIGRYNLQTIYTEPQFSDRQIQAIALDLAVSLKTLDPIGGTMGKDTYLQLMQFNLDQLFKL